MTDPLWEGTEFDRPAPKKSLIPDVLPHDAASEVEFLTTISWWGNTPRAIEASHLLESSDFFIPANRFFFDALKALYCQDVEPTFATVRSEMEKAGTLDRAGGDDTITRIFGGDSAEQASVLAEKIKEKSRLRSLISLGEKLCGMASGLSESTEILSEASEAITRLSSTTKAAHIITDLTSLEGDLVEGRKITTANGGRAMSWGDATLDDLCPIPRGEPTLVVARFGVGKTSIAVQSTIATIERGLGKPLFLSLEMGEQKIKARFAAHLSGTNSRAFRDGVYDAGDIQRIMSRREVLAGVKVMFPDQQCKVEEIASLVRHAVDVHGCDCVVLDQFSHVAPPRKASKENYAIANAMLSQELTALAKNLNLGWMTLAQLSRDGEDTRKPGKRDLAGTDRLGQDAAVILGLWNKGTDDNQDVWATIIKNRDDGHTGWARPMDTDHGTCSFRIKENETFAPPARPRF